MIGKVISPSYSNTIKKVVEKRCRYRGCSLKTKKALGFSNPNTFEKFVQFFLLEEKQNLKEYRSLCELKTFCYKRYPNILGKYLLKKEEKALSKISFPLTANAILSYCKKKLIDKPNNLVLNHLIAKAKLWKKILKKNSDYPFSDIWKWNISHPERFKKTRTCMKVYHIHLRQMAAHPRLTKKQKAYFGALEPLWVYLVTKHINEIYTEEIKKINPKKEKRAFRRSLVLAAKTECPNFKKKEFYRFIGAETPLAIIHSFGALND